jgi:NAD(P)-dependent dehydrogenase (short-subunit alcohol dehydrogenase family)
MTDVDEDLVRSAARDLGGRALAMRADVTQPDDVRVTLEEAAAAFGGLDIVVNNAGIEIGKPIVEPSTDEVRRLLDIIVVGVFHGIKYAVPVLAPDGGVIINIASVAGLGGCPLLGVYCASKGAVLRLTETAAIELRDAGIRVCAIAPAFVDTTMVQRLTPAVEELTQTPFGDLVAVKQGRLGTPEDVAEGVAFLASDEADWITGQPLVLDGGLTGSLL